jgi:tRNA acetyltransferase TAN1
LLSEFNLLVATSRGNERNACSEIWYLLRELGDDRPQTDRTEAIGLVVAKTKMSPVEVVQGLSRKLVESPWKFRYIQKVTPLEKVVPSDFEEIEKCVSAMVDGIGREESFRITVKKRHTKLSSKEIVERTARIIERRVDLEHPDRLVLIEVLGESTGISLIKPTDILSVARVKRSI